MLDPIAIKFGEAVWHDRPYLHPQLRTSVERDFFDRDEEKPIAENILRSASRKPVVLVGERRAGKTSLLKLLAHRLSDDPSGSFVPVLIPWQGISTRDELLNEILQGIAFELDREPLPLSQPSDRATHYGLTTTVCIEALRYLLAVAFDKTVVICIDEFDSLIEEAPDIQEKSRILELVTALAETSDLPIKLLLTITRIPNVSGTQPSLLFTEAALVPLRPFSKDDLDKMIQTLVGQQRALSPEELQHLYELSGGWPYFAKLLLVCLAGVSSEAGLEQVLAQATAHPVIEQTLENIYLRHFNEAEKAMMLLLAKRGGRIDLAETEIIDSTFTSAANDLVERNFISRSEEGNYCFRIGFLREWFPKWIKFEEEVIKHKYLEDTLRRLEYLCD